MRLGCLVRISVFSAAVILNQTALCEEDRTESVPVVFVLQKPKGGTNAPMVFGDTRQWNYDFDRFAAGRWVRCKPAEALVVRPRAEAGEALRGTARFGPGRYRITCSGTLTHPYRCDTRFTVSSSATTPLVVEVRHDSRKRVKARIRVVDKHTGECIGNVCIHARSEHTVIGETRKWRDREYVHRVNKIKTDANGVASFWFWDKVQDIEFSIEKYSLAKSRHPLKRNFSSAELQKGATWPVQERPVKARVKLSLKTADGRVLPLNLAVARKFLYKETTKEDIQYWRLPIFADGPDVSVRFANLAADGGEFLANEHAFVYRDLVYGTRYVVGKQVALHDLSLLLAEGALTRFSIKKGQVFTADAAIRLERRNTNPDAQAALTLTGEALDENGKPVENVMIRAFGVDGIVAVCSGTNGKFVASLAAGSHLLSAQKKGYSPWKKRIQLMADGNKHECIELERQPALLVNVLRGNTKRSLSEGLFVYGSDPNTCALSSVNTGSVTCVEAVPTGNALLVFRGSGERNNSGVSTNGYLIGIKHINIDDSKNTKVDLTVHAGIRLPFTLAGNSKIEFREAAVLIWQQWHGRRIHMGGGVWTKGHPGENSLFLPGYGRYAVEVVVPKGQTNDKYKLGIAYRGNTVQVDPNTKTLRIRMDERTKHEFRPFL